MQRSPRGTPNLWQQWWAIFSLHPTPWTYNIFVLTRLFIAGFFAYLYLRFFTGFTSAIAGGITSMLSGYFMLYITMPHVSVEVLLPAVFFSIELLLRKPGRSSILTHALVTLFVLFGGNPQSSLLTLTFGYLYFLFRIAADRALRSSILSHGLRVACAGIMGFGSASMLLLPFAEFMRLPFDTHQSQSYSVEYRYEPESFRLGLWISGGFLLLLLVFWRFPVKRVHKARV